ncbi:MAG: hypothetical protein IKU10_03755 [Clostridia bacterium]|nr:hypothetical protein [Clostridia bacterium]
MKRYICFAVAVLCLLMLFGCGKSDPFILDGPNMERDLGWTEFTLSSQSDVYEQNFSLTVTMNEQATRCDLLVYTIATGGDDPQPIPLQSKTVDRLLAMNLEDLEDKPPVSNEELILDGTTHRLEVVDKNGVTHEKVITQNLFDQINQLLTPYYN